MKRTYDANIGGTIFHVEEDAYHRLEAYLESVKAHFRSYPDSADIVTDIESRIAEQFAQRGPSSRVVMLTDVDAIIAVMGSVDQFDAPAAPRPEPARPEAPAEPVEQPGPRWSRLLRDRDDSIVAGVAAGVARYFGIAPRWIRLAFLAPIPWMFLLEMTGESRFRGDDVGRVLMFEVLLYLVLWLCIPQAKTAASPVAEPGSGPRWRRLVRERDDSVVAGVAAAIARYFGIGPRWIRFVFLAPGGWLLFLALTRMGSVDREDLMLTVMGEVLVYLVLWLLIPAAKPATGATSDADSAPRTKRRLFRDPDNMLVAGVAGGVAQYLGIASRVVRAAFLLPVPLMVVLSAMDMMEPGMEGILKVGLFDVTIYLLLWFAIPLAKTSIDKLKMRGHAVTLATVAQQVRDDTPQASQSGASTLMSAVGVAVRTLVLGTAWFTGFLVAAWAIITTIGLTVLLTVVMTNPSIIPLTRRLAAVHALGFKFYPFAVCCYLLAVVPLVLIAVVVVPELQRRRGIQWNRPSSSVYIGSMAVWMVALIAWAWLWASSVKPSSNGNWFEQQCETVYYVPDSTAGQIYVGQDRYVRGRRVTLPSDSAIANVMTETRCESW